MLRFFVAILFLFFVSCPQVFSADLTKSTVTSSNTAGVNTLVVYYDVVADGSGAASGTVNLGAGGFAGVWVIVDETATADPGGTLYFYRGTGTIKADLLGGTGVGTVPTTEDLFFPSYDGSVFRVIPFSADDTLSVSMSGLGAGKKCRLGFEVRK